LNVDGHIHSEEINHDLFAFGYSGTDLQHNTDINLVSVKEQQSKYTLIQWSFSTPVFGKRTSSTTETKEQTHASVTASIEQGATIDAVETVKIAPVTEEHHDDHTGVKVAAGLAAAGAVAGIIHHQQGKKQTEQQSHSSTTVTVTIEEIKVTIYQWYLRFNGRVSARLQQGGADAKTDVEHITKEAREELTVIIKESKDKANKGWAANEKANAELEIALQKVQGSVLEQVTEVETIVKTTTEVDVINKKLIGTADKAKTSIYHHLDSSIHSIHSHHAADAVAGEILVDDHHHKKVSLVFNIDFKVISNNRIINFFIFIFFQPNIN
jgi:hypothetical protein